VDIKSVNGQVPGESPQVVSDLISLVTNMVIPVAVVATWTAAEREEAARWAGGEHLHASDNTGVKRTEQPEFVSLALGMTGNPALAQLAVEGWVNQRELAGAAPDDMAQAAITGLLILLGDERPMMTWQAKAKAILGAHPGGVRPSEVSVLLGRGGPSQEALDEWLTAGEDAGAFETVLPDTWRLRGAAG
jgi:hypothetical protein